MPISSCSTVIRSTTAPSSSSPSSRGSSCMTRTPPPTSVTSNESAEPGLPGWARFELPAAIFVVTLAVFAPSLGGEFLSYDDEPNFVQNPRYQGLGWTQIRWMFTTMHAGHYQPLSWLTLGLDYSIWGLKPLG